MRKYDVNRLLQLVILMTDRSKNIKTKEEPSWIRPMVHYPVLIAANEMGSPK